jgi:CRP-like cAMP-binding protein
MNKLIVAIGEYVSLSPEDILIIEQLFVKKELKAQDCFLNAGKQCKDFAFIETGLFRHYINHEGIEETYFFSSENEFVCDYDSFINKTVSDKNIQALEDTIIYSISYDNLQLFYSKVKNGERFGRLFLEQVFSRAIKHILSTHTDSAEQRYHNFLKQFKHLQQRIPQYYIASFVGVTPQSLSRIRRRMLLKRN